MRLIFVFAALCGVAAVFAGGWYGYQYMTKTRPAHADLAYGSVSARQVLDVYLPEGAAGPVPVVLWVHGGAFRMGDKSGPQSLDARRTVRNRPCWARVLPTTPSSPARSARCTS